MPIDSSGEIKLSDIYDEFTGTHDGSQEIQMSDYRGDGDVPSGATDEIQLAADMYGASSGLAWAGTRAVVMGGWTYNTSGSGRSLNDVQYKTVVTDGNTADFDDLAILNHAAVGSGSNSTKVVKAGGGTFTSVGGWTRRLNTIESLTVSTTGSVIDNGDLNTGSDYGTGSGASNGTLCFFVGGDGNGANIEQMTISSGSGSSQAGDIATGSSIEHCQSNGDSKFLILGIGTAQNNKTAIDEHNFSTSANSSAYGNVATIGLGGSGVVCAVNRVVTAAGWTNASYTRGSRMQFFPVASSADGDSSDSADLVTTGTHPGGTSDGTRGEFYGLNNDQSAYNYISNTIQKITIASLSNATDIGDLQDNAISGDNGHTYSMAGGVSNSACQTGT